jgi:hypothetical protein
VLWSFNAGLTWRGSTGASGYTIERAEKPDGKWQVLAVGVPDSVIFDVKKYEDEKAYEPSIFWREETSEPNKKYYYRVKGVNAGGETRYSNLVEITR